MTVRFRIRTSAGQELSFASREMFEDFVRSGDLSPEDLVYDGETGSWSPARTHPTVLDIQYELEAEEEAAASGEGAEPLPETGTEAAAQAGAGTASADGAGADTSADEPSPDNSFGLSLAPEGDGAADVGAEAESGDAREGAGDAGKVDLDFDLALADELSPEDEQRVFLEKLEAERQAEVDSGPSIRESLSGFTSDTLAPRSEPPPPRAPDPPPRPKPSPSRGSGTGAKRPAERPTAPAQGGWLGRALLRVAILVLLVGGGYVAFELLAAGPEPDVDGGEPSAEVPPVQPVDEPPEPTPPAVEPEPEPTPEPVIPSTPAAVRERAQERYLTATQSALRDLQPIPEVWPEGPYITAPSEHPEVLDIWQFYRSTIRAVRQADVDRYRTAFVAALDDAAVPDEARPERIDAALGAFAAGAELREAHFDRVEALATAAIQSHNALLEAEGLIVYDATGNSGRSQGVGQGTSGLNDESQLLLNQVLDLLTAALDADGEGPGSGENVREWVWDGFLDAATR